MGQHPVACMAVLAAAAGAPNTAPAATITITTAATLIMHEGVQHKVTAHKPPWAVWTACVCKLSPPKASVCLGCCGTASFALTPDTTLTTVSEREEDDDATYRRHKRHLSRAQPYRPRAYTPAEHAAARRQSIVALNTKRKPHINMETMSKGGNSTTTTTAPHTVLLCDDDDLTVWSCCQGLAAYCVLHMAPCS